MPTNLLLPVFLCLPVCTNATPADSAPAVVVTQLAAQEDAANGHAEALKKLLSGERTNGEGISADDFLEHYEPGTRARVGDASIRVALGMFSRDLPGAEIEALRERDSNRWVLSMYSRKSGMGAEFDMTLEAAEPHRLLGLNARLVQGNPVIAELVDGMGPEEMASALDRIVGDMAAEDRFSGAVLLARDGEPFYEKAWGLASRRFDVPNRVDTRFNLGSMNKMFTALAICQLQEAGKLEFSDKLSAHLPNYPNADVSEQISIHQLLTHTSGLGDFWGAMSEVDWTTLRTPADHLPLFANDPLQFKPGERFSYSNAGFLVLGLVVEEISGMDYFDYVREHIYEPAGMTSTDSWHMDEPVKNLAIGYTRAGADGHDEGGPLRNNYYLHRARGGPAGGGFSTVGDLNRFGLALLNSDLLSLEGVQNLLGGKVNMGWGDGGRYCYGFISKNQEGHESVGHSGGAPGINASFRMFPADGYTLVVLTNCDGAASYVGGRIEEMIRRSDK
ncbi:MAG: CubicO group peptidase (beta-lactamase class C family) [Planctomycetota bacterium]|jgi:CubicO group peptidase (beta-lactamase class C family)